MQSWTIAPKEESPEIRKLRLYSYMDFLGPAGFGTPDDVEAIEAAQRGYKGAEDYGGWNDISAGVAPEGPDELREARRRGPDARVLDQVAGISFELTGRRAMSTKKSKCERCRSKPPAARRARRRSIERSRRDIIRGAFTPREWLRIDCAARALRCRRKPAARGAQPPVGGRACGAKDQRGFMVADIDESRSRGDRSSRAAH